jgi:ureidoacrylate peracid hydrolase
VPLDHTYTLEPARTALLVVDMQNSFCHPNGSIGRGGGSVAAMAATIPQVKRLIEAARQAGIRDVWTVQNHYAQDATRLAHRITPHTVKRSSGAPALKGTFDAEIVDELKELSQEPAEIVVKHRFSAFLDTRLETLLRIKDIHTLILCGVSTSLCVETSARDAYQRDYDVIVVSDAVASSWEAGHQASLAVIDKYFGAVATTDEALQLMNPIASKSVASAK